MEAGLFGRQSALLKSMRFFPPTADLALYRLPGALPAIDFLPIPDSAFSLPFVYWSALYFPSFVVRKTLEQFATGL